MDVRHFIFGAITLILLLGTSYSVLYSTYLDTSSHLLSHRAHHLAQTHYFASKSNPLNVYFIKKAWGWTTLAFLATFLTSPSAVRTRQRFFKYLILTGVWVLFTSWFFGPALLERAIVLSGGECVAVLPSGDPVTVPTEFCYTRSALAPKTHPELFVHHAASLAGVLEEWRVVPRLRKGHDVSGHVFLLTMSVLFLADQLRPSFRPGAARRWSNPHMWAVAAQVSLVGIWLFAIYTTSVYFHSPFEKFTGYLLGVASFLLTQIPSLQFPPEVASTQRVPPASN
ncbi:unnamed protein product [Cyclocybe aegerita]|uniref:Fat storage-inducing transmembrane protein n=1 Tax=Cyclocybe aegerita TaxID=1973307 RepID=A0A8S0XDQ7_CYCAE|nr:unnamed protein product [Cyclocybe aegerita]